MLSFGPKHADLPFELPSGSSEIDLRVQVARPGDFASTVKLFVEDDGLREVPLSVHGRAVAGSPSSEKAP